MGKRKYTTEQTIIHLQEVEVRCSQGWTIQESARQIGITEQTHYRWRKQYGGMSITNTKRVKALEKENGWLKKLVLFRIKEG